MNGLNIKGLVKQIKASKKDLIWSFKNGTHTISNRHWMINIVNLPQDVKIALFSIFAEFPEEGKHIRYDRFSESVMRGDSIDFEGIKNGANKGSAGDRTKFTSDISDYKARVFKREGTYVYVNEAYLLAVEGYSGEILMTDWKRPIFFKDENYLVLPYRVVNEPEKEILELFCK